MEGKFLDDYEMKMAELQADNEAAEKCYQDVLDQDAENRIAPEADI